MNLSKIERSALKEQAGITHAVVIEERITGTKYGSHTVISRLIRGRSEYGDTVWGWWDETEGAADVRWSHEKANA